MTASDPNGTASNGSATSSTRSPTTSPPPALTLSGLSAMVDAQGRMPLDATLIASTLYPQLDASTTGRDLIETHLLVLEETGFLALHPGDSTWWLALSPHASPSPEHPPASRSAPATSPQSSTAIKREQEETHTRERALAAERAAARSRAWAQMDHEDRDVSERWQGWDRRVTPITSRPERPLLLNAPPLGCSEHPHGLVSGTCGPCGSAARYREDWLTRERYGERLALFEEASVDDQPF